MEDPKAAIREKALALGFDAVGFAPAALSVEARDNLARYLDQGLHGDMGWLAAKADRRGDPKTLWPDARSVIVLGMNYGSPETPNAHLGEAGAGVVSVYARGRDCHDVIKSRLKALARWLAESRDCQVKVFVDTAPVMEKPLAEAAGIGWQGKHTNLVSRDFGSWLFLGEVFTDLALEPDTPHADNCGACRACLDACPTAAFPAPYRLDAALRLLPDDRAQGTDPAGSQAFARQPHLWLRRLPCRLSLEQVRDAYGRARSPPARRADRAAPRRAGRPRRRRLPSPLLGIRGQAPRP